MGTASEKRLLKIRLRRVGAKKQPSYRIVVADGRAARDGAFVEQLGHYDPKTDPPTIVLDRERADEWIGKGAQPTDSVVRLFKTHESQQNSAGQESDAVPEPAKTIKKSAKTVAKTDEAPEETAAEEPASEEATEAEGTDEATAESAGELAAAAGDDEAAEEPVAEERTECEFKQH